MYCVGLTGNIASGKSTVLSYFSKLGAATLSADAIAKELTIAGEPAFIEIQHYFGLKILNPAGQLNRKLLRDIIFSDPKHRLWLENLLHPLIRKAIQDQLLRIKAPYCMIEIPLLLNRTDYPYLNQVLVVIADYATQVQRLMYRDHCDINQAKAILAVQPEVEARKNMADDIIDNTISQQNLMEKVEQLNKKYLQLAIQ